MGLIVQKYGGTSVGDLGRIKDVAKKVVSVKDRGDDIVVVVSAMAGETNRLIALAKQMSDSPSDRELDMLISSGERMSSALLCMALHSLGYKAISFTGRQVGIITDDAHTNARIKKIDSININKALKNGQIVVVAGFQGISETDDDVTTLGRGGSDLTAVALAASLKADICEIYTDVDGVYTTDPNVVPNARRIERISFEEMLELASLGAKVLQTRSVEFAKRYNLPIWVKSTFTDGGGTIVTMEDKEMEKEIVSGVAYDKNQAKITILGVPDKPGIASKIFSKVAENNYIVDMIIQNVSEEGFTDISFTIPKKDTGNIAQTMKNIAREIEAKDVKIDGNIAKISVVGIGMKSHSGVAAKFFSAFAAENINIMMISTSEIKISCIIEDKYTELAVRAIHNAFDLGKDQVTRNG